MDRQNLSSETELLTRDAFREGCFARDGHCCVICGQPAVDAHHIIERRLWTDPGEEGGYFLANGSSVCERHHRAAEQTLVSPEELRRAAGIKHVMVPSHLYDDGIEAGSLLTKWGDLVLSDGRRSPGELFWDESVQRVLAEGRVLQLYTSRYRYPRTYHVPFSTGRTKDDRVLRDLSAFAGRRIIVTRKLDGENTTILSDGNSYARSPDGSPHPSQSRVRAMAATVGPLLDRGWRLCGENLVAKHSIHYRALSAYFFVISIWNSRNECQSWDDTVLYANLLSRESGLRLPTVPVLYDGIFNESILRGLHRPTDENGDEAEGWVMRVADAFAYRDFGKSVAKMVRAGHVVEHAQHWRRGPIIENELRK